jgi:diguanylate cyclase (GGDEF)-like protein
MSLKSKNEETDFSSQVKKIDAANAEAYALRSSNPSRAAQIVNRNFDLAICEGYLKGQADALKVFGTLCSRRDRDLGFKFANMAIELYQEIADEHGECGALMTVALYYQKQGRYAIAHETLTTAYYKAVNSGNVNVEALAHNNLGVQAEERKDYAQAGLHYEHAKDAAQRAGNTHMVLLTHIACEGAKFLGGIRPTDIKKIEKLYQEALEQKSFLSAIDACLTLSRIYSESLDIKNAILYLRRGSQLASQKQILYSNWIFRFIRGELSEKRGRYFSAIRAFESGLKKSEQLDILIGQRECSEKLARAYRVIGAHERAFDSLNNYVLIINKTFDSQSESRIEELETVHQVALVEAESKILRQKNNELAAINVQLEQSLRERRQLQDELERLATMDELTGVYNRRRILAIGTDMLDRFQTMSRPGIAMIADIDFFKSINDQYGHSVGDEVLRRFTQSCQRVMRPSDAFGRLGGEEFCILLDNTDFETGLRVAERILVSVRNTRLEDIVPDRVLATSIGITQIMPSHQTIEQVMHDADTGLYQAKRSGRDRVCREVTDQTEAA